MSDLIVIDASVAVKWVVDEEHTDRALALLHDALSARQTVYGPPLLVGEVANTILQRERRGDITQIDADAALARFLAAPLIIAQPPNLIEEGFRFARDHELPAVYDSFYVVLARAMVNRASLTMPGVPD